MIKGSTLFVFFFCINLFVISSQFFVVIFFFNLEIFRKGADVAKWIKAVDCESTMRGFNSRRSPLSIFFNKRLDTKGFFFSERVTAYSYFFFLFL